MHMSDALLSPIVSGVMTGISGGTAAYAVHRMNLEESGQRQLPMMAVSGAFVFAAQMINFAIPGTGSSGHIGGGILLAGLLSGFPAFVTIAAVLIIQCLFFADGGLLALGANIFNMGVIPCLIVYPLLFRPLLRGRVNRKRITWVTILSSIVSLQLGAFCVVLETMASGVTELPFRSFVLLMQPIHLAIGVVEGIVTAAILNFVYQMRPELLTAAIERKPVEKGRSAKWVVVSLAVLAVLIGGGLSLYASGDPDGLEWSMERTAGTFELNREDPVHKWAAGVQEKLAVLPDYDYAEEKGNGTSVAGVAGALLTCLLVGGTGGVISAVRRKRTGREHKKEG